MEICFESSQNLQNYKNMEDFFRKVCICEIFYLSLQMI